MFSSTFISFFFSPVILSPFFFWLELWKLLASNFPFFMAPFDGILKTKRTNGKTEKTISKNVFFCCYSDKPLKGTLYYFLFHQIIRLFLSKVFQFVWRRLHYTRGIAKIISVFKIKLSLQWIQQTAFWNCDVVKARIICQKLFINIVIAFWVLMIFIIGFVFVKFSKNNEIEKNSLKLKDKRKESKNIN